MKLLENNWVLLFQFERKFPRCNFTFTPHNLLFGLTRAICSILCKCAFASMRMFKQSNYCRWSLKSSNCECKPTFKTVQAEIPDILTKYLISIPKSVISESKFAHKCGFLFWSINIDIWSFLDLILTFLWAGYDVVTQISGIWHRRHPRRIGKSVSRAKPGGVRI